MLLLITVLILLTYTVVLLMFFMGWCALLPKIAHPRPEMVPFSVVKSPRRNSVFISFESMSSNSIQSLDYLHHKLSLSSCSIAPPLAAASSAAVSPRLSETITEHPSITVAAPKACEKKRSASSPNTPNTPTTNNVDVVDGRTSNTSSQSTSSGVSSGSDENKNVGGILRSPKQNDYLHPKYSLPPIKIDIADHLLADQHLLRTPVHLHCSPIVNNVRRMSKSYEKRRKCGSVTSPNSGRCGSEDRNKADTADSRLPVHHKKISLPYPPISPPDHLTLDQDPALMPGPYEWPTAKSASGTPFLEQRNIGECRVEDVVFMA